ncbi:hypothetical protein CSUB01_09405 [Colletotrichum sublineola]|uniref:Uncharacterized protein n=1 Tax=Colletotrichum sublineola TaxID=1173701 RepID=A0A066XPY9_COLSU|nr:hypothetical protein CSUB01_09405 [Colletotrichum sublineola]
MVHSIYETGANVVLQLDFKDQDAVEPAYWALKNLTNRAGVPANEWCIYKLQAKWWKNPAEFEALDWVQDAFAAGVQLAELEMYSTGGPLQDLQNYITHNVTETDTFKTSGIFYAPGDFFDFITSNLTRFDTANYSIPADIRKNNSAYKFQNSMAPALLDSIVGNKSSDGHDHRSDFDWIMKQGFQWVITDTADFWDAQLRAEGRRNISYILAGKEVDGVSNGWY